MSDSLQYVIDSNICIKLFIPDPLTAKADTLFLNLQNSGTQFFVPDLFYIEFTNVLWKYVRARQYTVEQSEIAIRRIQAFPLNITSTKDLIADAIKLSVTYGISAYDASYVALSQRTNAPLLTLDAKLANALNTSNLDIRLFG
jgi:predicted nucleic acid-binding protein